MASRRSEATWIGDLTNGNGTMRVGSGLFEGRYTHASRFKEGEGTNPEELIGAAIAGCYSMYLSAILSRDDHIPNHIHTTGTVHIDRIDGALTIHTIELDCKADVPDIDAEKFMTYANRAKAECPVSKALAAVKNLKLSATLDS